MAQWRMKGQYLKNCNRLASCPCDTMGMPAPNSFCEGMAGMHIQEGHFDHIDLSRLTWVGVVHFPRAMHEGNGDWEIYIDERASAPQRAALEQILTGKAGGPFFAIVAAVAPIMSEPTLCPSSGRLTKRSGWPGSPYRAISRPPRRRSPSSQPVTSSGSSFACPMVLNIRRWKSPRR